jgi:flagellar biogenesis protein FliO
METDARTPLMPAAQTTSTASASPAWLARLLASLSALLRCVKVRRHHSLRLCETLPLGEKRFLAVVQFEDRRFLIGATNQTISLLDRLENQATQPRLSEAPSESRFLEKVR